MCVGDVGKKYEQFVQQSDNSGLFMSSCHPHEGRPPQLVTEWFINYGNRGEVYVTEVREAAFEVMVTVGMTGREVLIDNIEAKLYSGRKSWTGRKHYKT